MITEPRIIKQFADGSYWGVALERPPLEAVLAELLHKRLFMRWLERDPDRMFCGTAGEATSLGLYIVENSPYAIEEFALHASEEWHRIMWRFADAGVAYTARDVLTALKEVEG